MAETEDNEAIVTEEEPLQRAFLFELENVLMGTRRILYDLLSKILKDKGVKLTPILFSRYCLGEPASVFIPAILKAKKKDKVVAENLVKSLNEKYNAALKSKAGKITPSFKTLLTKAKKSQRVIGALTQVGVDEKENHLKRMELADLDITMLSYSSGEKLAPSADAWLKLAKKVAAQPPLCVAVATSAMSCKAALSAGMRCIVVEDEFTSCEDFGGADYITTSVDDNLNKVILTLLENL
ncbi:MAG: HAD family phosphatase [Kiritimatiellae bacterium]|nr:HAD family phosphatase [Kiritimatiellia bacterium]